MDEIRAGVIGVGGFFGNVHLPCLRRIAGLRLVAACARRESSRAKAAKQIADDRVKLYADFRDLLADKDVNAVYVLTPPAAMLEIVREVAKARLPLFCEKPPGSTSQDARQMADACAEAKLNHLVAFNRRFGPFTDRTRQWLAEAGPATRIEISFRRTFSKCPTALVGNGIHAIDLMISLLGPVRRVMSARAAQRGGEGFSHFHAALQFAGGASGTFNYDNRMATPAEEYHISCVSEDTFTVSQLDLVFPTPTKVRQPCKVVRRKLVYRDWGPGGAIFDTLSDEFVVPELADRAEDDLLIGGGYLGEHEAFAASLRGGPAGAPTFDQTVHSMEVAETIQAGLYREFDT